MSIQEEKNNKNVDLFDVISSLHEKVNSIITNVKKDYNKLLVALNDGISLNHYYFNSVSKSLDRYIYSINNLDYPHIENDNYIMYISKLDSLLDSIEHVRNSVISMLNGMSNEKRILIRVELISLIKASEQMYIEYIKATARILEKITEEKDMKPKKDEINQLLEQDSTIILPLQQVQSDELEEKEDIRVLSQEEIEKMPKEIEIESAVDEKNEEIEGIRVLSQDELKNMQEKIEFVSFGNDSIDEKKEDVGETIIETTEEEVRKDLQNFINDYLNNNKKVQQQNQSLENGSEDLSDDDIRVITPDELSSMPKEIQLDELIEEQPFVESEEVMVLPKTESNIKVENIKVDPDYDIHSKRIESIKGSVKKYSGASVIMSDKVQSKINLIEQQIAFERSSAKINDLYIEDLESEKKRLETFRTKEKKKKIGIIPIREKIIKKVNEKLSNVDSKNTSIINLSYSIVLSMIQKRLVLSQEKSINNRFDNKVVKLRTISYNALETQEEIQPIVSEDVKIYNKVKNT